MTPYSVSGQGHRALPRGSRDVPEISVVVPVFNEEATLHDLFDAVSEALEGKGRQRFMGCGPEGRLGLALQDKHRTEGNGAFFNLQRGEIVRLGGATDDKGDGLGLNESTTIELVARAGQPIPRG